MQVGPPDAGHLGGMIKLKPAPSFIDKVISSIYKHNGTSQKNYLCIRICSNHITRGNTKAKFS